MTIEKRLHDPGLELPDPIRLPPGVTLSFPWVRTYRNRVFDGE